jgi:hypothetical protein
VHLRFANPRWRRPLGWAARSPRCLDPGRDCLERHHWRREPDPVRRPQQRLGLRARALGDPRRGPKLAPSATAGRVISLEAAAGQVDLVASPCQPGTPCPGTSLLQSPAGSDSFVLPVARQSTTGRDNGALALHPPAGFAALGVATSSTGSGAPTTVQATADTRTWRPFPDPCRVSWQLALSSIAAADARKLFTLCSGEGAAGSTAKQVVATANGQSTPVGAASRVGDGGQLAAATSSTLLLATSRAASWLDRSIDGGRRWANVAQYNDGGAGFVDLGFTTPPRASSFTANPRPVPPSMARPGRRAATDPRRRQHLAPRHLHVLTRASTRTHSARTHTQDHSRTRVALEVATGRPT